MLRLELGKDSQGRSFTVIGIRSLDDWPGGAHQRFEDFGLFLACDANAIETVTLERFAKSAIQQRCAFVCCWGDGCEKAHGAFDSMRDAETSVARNPEGVLMTTWHDDETLSDALWYFTEVAFVDEDYAAEPKLLLVVSVGSDERAQVIAGQLRQVAKLQG